MNANVMKFNESFYSTKELKRTPATEENRQRCTFIDGHEFSFQVDIDSKRLKSMVKSK